MQSKSPVFILGDYVLNIISVIISKRPTTCWAITAIVEGYLALKACLHFILLLSLKYPWSLPDSPLGSKGS